MNCFCHKEFKLDNNYIEGHIRPFCIGRKNWMFSIKSEGAEASAHIGYLNGVFKNLPQAEKEQDFLDLLPVKIVNELDS